MNKQEFQRFMTELEALIPTRTAMTSVEVGLWSQAMAPLDFEDASKARNDALISGIKFPSVSDVVSRVRDTRERRIAVHGLIVPDVDPDDVSAFQAARRAVTRQIAGVSPAGRSLDGSGHRVLEA